MFSFLKKKPKAREITSPQEHLWVRCFFATPPRPDELPTSQGRLRSIVSSIPRTRLTADSLQSDLAVPTRQFLANLFHLDSGIPSYLHDLALAILEQPPGDDVLGLLAPFVLQFAVRFTRRFPALSANPDLLSRYARLVRLLFLLPPDCRADVHLVVGGVFSSVASLLVSDRRQCHEEPFVSFMSSLVPFSEDFPDFEIRYLVFWCGEADSDRFKDCVRIVKSLAKGKVIAELVDRLDFASGLLSTGFNVFGLSFAYAQLPEDVFEFGCAFIDLMKCLVNVSDQCAMLVWEHQMLSFIVFFVAWTLDRFPFISFQLTGQEQPDEAEAKLFESNTDRARYEFASEGTFPVGIEFDQEQLEVWDLDERLGQNPQIDRLLRNLVELAGLRFGEKFVFTVLETMFDFPTVTKLVFKNGREVVQTSLFCVLVCFIHRLPKAIILRILPGIQGFKRLLASPVFRKKFYFWTSEPNSPEMTFCRTLRKMIWRLFISFGDVAFCDIDVDVCPQAVGEFVEFLAAAYEENGDVMRFVDQLIRLSRRLHGQHIELVSQNVAKMFVVKTGQARTQLLNFYKLMAEDQEGKSVLFRKPEFSSLLFEHLFVPALQDLVLELLGMGFVGQALDHLFGELQKLFQEALKHKGEAQWIALMQKCLRILSHCLESNRQMLRYCDQFNFLVDGSMLVTISDDLVKDFLQCCVPIARGSPYWRKKVAKFPMRQVAKTLMKKEIDSETINLFLGLIFESPISIDNFPKTAEISNQKILPFLHEITCHLPVHIELFSFFDSICALSATNKLRVYRSRFLISILKYIQSFGSRAIELPENQQSVNILFTLFATVSTLVFQWKLFFESISSMRPVKGYRSWWTIHLVSAFSAIFASSTGETPPSFFNLDGRKSGVKQMGTIDCSEFESGLTFMVHFELGQCQTGKSCLWLMHTTDGQRLTLTFDADTHLVIRYEDEFMKFVQEEKCAFAFEPNVWYRFVFSIGSRLCNVYVDGRREFSCKAKWKFQKVVSKMSIACSESGENLRCNISAVYLLRSALSGDIIRVISNLPVDFVYSFSPNTLTMFPELQSSCGQLFSDSMSSKQVLCYNARMTLGNDVAVNLSTNSVGNAQFVAEPIPFSSSFCDVIQNTGGLKTFLPLFDQVDLLVADQTTDDSSNFLAGLVGLFAQFCQFREDVEADFFENDGPKCMAHCLRKIKPTSLEEIVINHLSVMYHGLRSDEHKLTMLQDIWLNVPLWQVHSPSIRIYVIRRFLIDLFKSPRDVIVFLKSMKFMRLVFVVLHEPHEEIRAQFWKVLEQLAALRFPEPEQSLFFLVSIVDSDIALRLHLELLEHVLMFLTQKTSQFHLVLEKQRFYLNVVALFSSPHEEVRVYALQILLQIFLLQSAKDIGPSPLSFARSILTALKRFNPGKSNTNFWHTLAGIYMDHPAIRESIFPLIVWTSKFEQPGRVKEFVVVLENNYEALAGCSVWYLWLLYFLGERSKDLYAKICIVLLNTDRFSEFVEAISFLQALIARKKWNLIDFLRGVFMAIFENLGFRERVVSVLVPDVLLFMFYIPNVEPYCENVQLRSRYLGNSERNWKATDFGNLEELQMKAEAEPLKFTNFSARISEDDEWLDIDLAIDLAEFLAARPSLVCPFGTLRLKLSEWVGFLLGFIVRSDCRRIPTCLPLFQRIAGESLPFMLFFIQFSYVCGDNFKSFVTTYAKSVQSFVRSGVADPSQAVQLRGEELAEFYGSLTDQADNVCIYVNSRIDAVIQIVGAAFAGLPDLTRDPAAIQLIDDVKGSFTSSLQRRRAVCEKAYKRIFRGLSTNGGPWVTSQTEPHWKLWQMCDACYRRIFVRPNFRFDLHKEASFLRDESSAQVAHQKYERWLTTQEIVPEPQQPFKDENEFKEIESAFTTEAELITLAKQFSGQFYLNQRELCFNDPNQSKSIQFFLNEIEMVLHRSYLHIDNGLEFFLVSKRSYFLYFLKGDRARVLRFLRGQSLPTLKVLQTGPSRDVIRPFTDKWRTGQISNYEYLMYCNFFSGRSFNDLSQYPVFPWVLRDFRSQTIDLNNPSVYRDLSFPVGKLNESRFAGLYENYRECPDELVDKCLYRFHYSNAFYVLHFLARMEPFTTLHIEVNDRKFDKPSRMFISIQKTFEGVTSRSPDFRELLPEFFSLPDFLFNDNHFDLGVTDLGVTGDVELPPWANGNAHKFIQMHRQALESRFVSEHLNEWIDLIFGFANSGPEAARADNTFHPYCYESSITREVLADPDLLKTIQAQASNVGIVPRQIFTAPHPRRQQPNYPNFSNARLMFLVKLPVKPRYLHLHRDVLYVLDDDGWLWSLIIKSKSNLRPMGRIQEFLVQTDDVIPSKSFVFLWDIGRMVISSLWDNTFHVFKIDQTSVSHVVSVRQKFALVSTLTAAGGSSLLASWRDSSLTLWSLADSRPRSLYRRTPHLTTVVDVDANASLRLVASLDKNRKCILSRLDTGGFIRSFDVPGSDSVEKVMLFSCGYLAVRSELVMAGAVKTTIRLYGVGTKLISEKEFDEVVVEWCLAEFANCEAGVVMALKSGRVLMLGVPDLAIVFEVKCEEEARLIAFSSHLNSFVVGTSVRKLYFISLE
jgi:hypothetical protein